MNMVTILMMSAKLSTPALLKIKVFWNKSYHVITSIHNVSGEILSRDSNYIVDDQNLVALVFLWEKLS